MKLAIELMKDACTVSTKLAMEEAERALGCLYLEEGEEAALSGMVNDLAKQAHGEAKKLGFSDRSKGRLRRPSEEFGEDSYLNWGINVKGLKRSEEFTELKSKFLSFIKERAPQYPAGRREQVLYEVQACVLRLIRIAELQGYEDGYSLAVKAV